MGWRVLVVAAHPDDDSLGCGAAIARWVQEGRQAVVAFLTDSIGAPSDTDQPAGERRRVGAPLPAPMLRTQAPRFAAGADNRPDHVSLVEWAEHLDCVAVQEPGQDTGLKHHADVVSIDHSPRPQAVGTRCRRQPGHPVGAVWSRVVPSSTRSQFANPDLAVLPTTVVEVFGHLEPRLGVLNGYQEEIRDRAHPHSRRALGGLRCWRDRRIVTADDVQPRPRRWRLR